MIIFFMFKKFELHYARNLFIEVQGSIYVTSITYFLSRIFNPLIFFHSLIFHAFHY